MNPWFAKAIILVGFLAIVIIPASLHRRGGEIKVVKSRKGPLESVLLTLTSLGFLLPLVWVVTPVLSFADYALRPFRLSPEFSASRWGCGFSTSHTPSLARTGRSPSRCGRSTSSSPHGIYRHVRHPMYLALLLYASGQALVLPNWVAGPSYLIAIALLFALRVGPEERMMREEFGRDYEAYMARTKRLVPGVW